MEHARLPNGRLYRAALVVAVVLTLGGGVLAYAAYQRNESPSGLVEQYFAALQSGDAASALALGDLPRGSRTLLTDTVLEEQQHVAPIGDVAVGSAVGHGERATVPVNYTLGFPGQSQAVSTAVPVHRAHGTWRLDRTALPVQLLVARAGNRATVLGARIPVGSVLLFPGAAPVTFDTANLQLTPSSAEIDFETGATLEMSVEVSAAGQARATSLVRGALASCLRGAGTAGCPLPDERYVPGSVRGTISGPGSLQVDVGTGVSGTIEVRGRIDVDATYRRLDFRNRTIHRAGVVQLQVRAVSYATDPMRFAWEHA